MHEALLELEDKISVSAIQNATKRLQWIERSKFYSVVESGLKAAWANYPKYQRLGKLTAVLLDISEQESLEARLGKEVERYDMEVSRLEQLFANGTELDATAFKAHLAGTTRADLEDYAEMALEQGHLADGAQGEQDLGILKRKVDKARWRLLELWNDALRVRREAWRRADTENKAETGGGSKAPRSADADAGRGAGPAAID